MPLIVSELGAFISVVLMATGHPSIGSTMYIALKIVGVSLIPVNLPYHSREADDAALVRFPLRAIRASACDGEAFRRALSRGAGIGLLRPR